MHRYWNEKLTFLFHTAITMIWTYCEVLIVQIIDAYCFVELH